MKWQPFPSFFKTPSPLTPYHSNRHIYTHSLTELNISAIKFLHQVIVTMKVTMNGIIINGFYEPNVRHHYFLILVVESNISKCKPAGELLEGQDNNFLVSFAY